MVLLNYMFQTTILSNPHNIFQINFRTLLLAMETSVSALMWKACNVPLAEVIDDICNYLFDNHSSYFLPLGPLKRNQTRMSKRTLKKMMKLCTEGMFLYNGKLYKQVDGVAMGSPLGPTLANQYMGTIEKKTFCKSYAILP